MEVIKHHINGFEDIKSLEFLNDCSNITSLWGVAPVAPLHLGYDSLILFQKELLLKSPHRHFILLADMHSILTHGFDWRGVHQRCYYYEYYFREICGLTGSDILAGSYFQTRTDYVEELYSTLSWFSHSKVRDSLPKPKRPNDPVPASAYIYSLMQCIDVFHVRSNCVIAEQGQEKIYDLILDFNNIKIKRAGLEGKFKTLNNELHFIYLPTGHDTKGLPLNRSTTETRISIHDSKQVLEKKIDGMYCPPDTISVEGKANALLEFFKYSVFPWHKMPINVDREDGSEGSYFEYKDFEEDYCKQLIHPTNAKKALKKMLWIRLNTLHHKLTGGVDSWIDFKKLGINDPLQRNAIA